MKPGFLWDSDEDGILKIFRAGHYDGTGSVFSYFTSGNMAPIYIFDLKKSLNWGWRHNHAFRCDPQESSYYCSDGNNADGLFADSSTQPGDPGQAADGEWHRYEFRLRMNTYSGGTWQSDGVLQFWYDGQMMFSVTDKRWITSGSDTSMGWNFIGIGGNAYNTYDDGASYGEQWYAIDDVVVSTTPIAADYVAGGGAVYQPSQPVEEDPAVEDPNPSLGPPSYLRVIR